MSVELIELSGENLTVDQVSLVSRKQVGVKICENKDVLNKVRRAQKVLIDTLARGEPIYGVTTKFGSLAGTEVLADDAAALQRNLLWTVKAGAGERIPSEDVRASMIVHLNAMLKGVSGIRLEILQRLEFFIQNDICPHVYELGSIGASGDLVPLGAIAGALVGIDPSFKVDVGGHSVGLRDMEKRFGLSPLSLGPKEGLALVNGISASAGIACNVLYDARSAFALTIATHGLMIEALEGSHQSFNPFVHQQKQHLGQKWVAEKIMDRLKNYDVRSAKSDHIQDRYSIRCLPQFLGPMAEGLGEIGRKLEVEINSVADNPLIDVENESFFHGGNFLGQYISEGMDRLRHYLGLAAKHMDAQIAVLVEPAYSNGLPASLIGNDESAVNMGLKGLQISANSIAPLLAFYGQPLADRFPTHAEQGNQNINSLSYSAACLAKKSIGLCQNHLAISLIFAVQALDLRCYKLHGHYDAQILLSEPAYKLYLAVHAVVCKPVNVECAFINNNDEQALDEYIKAIVKNIIEGGDILQSVSDIRLGHIQNF